MMLSYIGLAVALWVVIDLLVVLLIGPEPLAEGQQRGAQMPAR